MGQKTPRGGNQTPRYTPMEVFYLGRTNHPTCTVESGLKTARPVHNLYVQIPAAARAGTFRDLDRPLSKHPKRPACWARTTNPLPSCTAASLLNSSRTSAMIKSTQAHHQLQPYYSLFRKEEPQPPLSARHDMEESEGQRGSKSKVTNSMSMARRRKLVGAHIHAVQSCSHEHFSIHFKHPGLHRMGRGCIFVRLPTWRSEWLRQRMQDSGYTLQ